MKALFLTNEYPPHIYGGAGVHVGYLSRELAKTMDVEVLFDHSVLRARDRYLKFDTRSACSRITRALSSVRVPVGAPL